MRPGKNEPSREADLRCVDDKRDAEIGAERIERAAGQIDDLLHAEHELQAGGDQKQNGGVKDAADENIRERSQLLDLELGVFDPFPEIGAGRLLQVG
jgi:hypothetical protein